MQFLSNIKSKFGQWRQRDEVPNPQLQFQHLQPLKTVNLPQTYPGQQINLALNGWTTIDCNLKEDLVYSSFQELLQASQQFFELPDSYKEGFKTKLGTEEGWTRVEGEKEFITLRTLDATPEILKVAAAKHWAAAGALLNAQLGAIAVSLGLPAESLTVFSEPCATLGTEASATMLRLFRYEGYSGEESRIVAEEHKDLGLLSLVTGDTPGLEVWDRSVNKWYFLEKTYTTPASSVLVGRQLELLSNRRYQAGGHRVRSYPDPLVKRVTTSVAVPPKYRYSIVFVLRAHAPAIVNTDSLTTDITGKFERSIRDMTGGQLYKEIQSAHFNINTHLKEREEQKKKLADKKNEGDTLPISDRSFRTD